MNSKILQHEFTRKISLIAISLFLGLLVISIPILAEVYNGVNVIEQVYVAVNKTASGISNNIQALITNLNFTFSFEGVRDSNLPNEFYLRDGSDDIDADKYQWAWTPILKNKYVLKQLTFNVSVDGNNSFLLNLSAALTDKIIYSKTFASNPTSNLSFFELSFYYKTNFTDILPKLQYSGNLMQVGIEVLFEDGNSDDTWGILLTDEGLSEDPANLPLNFNVTVQDVGNGWKKIIARNLEEVYNRKMRVLITNGVSDLSSRAFVVIDNVKIVPLMS